MAPLDSNAPAPEEKAEVRRRKGAITRRIKQEVLTKYGLDRLPKQGERHLVRGGQGTGKSRVTVEQIAQLRGETVIWWMVPTLEKAEEQAQEYAALTSSDSMRAHVVRGRGAPDFRNPNEASGTRSSTESPGWAATFSLKSATVAAGSASPVDFSASRPACATILSACS